MVLTLKRWKSRSSPGIATSGSGVDPFTSQQGCPARAALLASMVLLGFHKRFPPRQQPPRGRPRTRRVRKAERPPAATRPSGRMSEERQNGIIAGWSSPVARQAHNLKVVGSNPTPATTVKTHHRSTHTTPAASLPGAIGVCVWRPFLKCLWWRQATRRRSGHAASAPIPSIAFDCILK